MEVRFSASEKKSADNFLMQHIQQLQPEAIFLDAPLSLPGVYRFPDGYTDYFYRKCDRQFNAMLPMFLGGLTARAMKLKASLQAKGVPVYETYPSAQARRMNLYESGYKQLKENMAVVNQIICTSYPNLILQLPDLTSWHHIDALLALIAGMRFCEGVYKVYGDEQEGVIII